MAHGEGVGWQSDAFHGATLGAEMGTIPSRKPDRGTENGNKEQSLRFLF